MNRRLPYQSPVFFSDALTPGPVFEAPKLTVSAAMCAACRPVCKVKIVSPTTKPRTHHPPRLAAPDAHERPSAGGLTPKKSPVASLDERRGERTARSPLPFKIHQSPPLPFRHLIRIEVETAATTHLMRPDPELPSLRGWRLPIGSCRSPRLREISRNHRRNHGQKSLSSAGSHILRKSGSSPEKPHAGSLGYLAVAGDRTRRFPGGVPMGFPLPLANEPPEQPDVRQHHQDGCGNGNPEGGVHEPKWEVETANGREWTLIFKEFHVSIASPC